MLGWTKANVIGLFNSFKFTLQVNNAETTCKLCVILVKKICLEQLKETGLVLCDQSLRNIVL